MRKRSLRIDTAVSPEYIPHKVDRFMSFPVRLLKKIKKRNHKLNWFQTSLGYEDIRDGRRYECLPLPIIKLTFVSIPALANTDAVNNA